MSDDLGLGLFCKFLGCVFTVIGLIIIVVSIVTGYLIGKL